MLEAQESPPFEKPSIEQVIKCIMQRERERDRETRKHTHTQNIHENHELKRNFDATLQLSPAHVFAHGTLPSKCFKLNLCCFTREPSTSDLASSFRSFLHSSCWPRSQCFRTVDLTWNVQSMI